MLNINHLNPAMDIMGALPPPFTGKHVELDRFFAKLNICFKLAKAKFSDEEVKILSDLLERHIADIDRYLDEKLEPEANGFSCVKIESFHNAHGERAVWTSSKCLLIKRSRYIELSKKEIIK
jgi:hypothetical protein